MGSSRVDIIDGAGVTQQDIMKQPGNIGPGFFPQVVLEKQVIGTRDHILHDPFVFCKRKGLILEKSEPACLDKERAVLIGYHQYILVLLCDKEHVIDGLLYHLAFLPSS